MRGHSITQKRICHSAQVFLFVEVIEAGKFPTRSRLLEVINHHFVSGRIRTRNTKMFRILCVSSPALPFRSKPRRQFVH